jgi:hypothetical protein
MNPGLGFVPARHAGIHRKLLAISGGFEFNGESAPAKYRGVAPARVDVPGRRFAGRENHLAHDPVIARLERLCAHSAEAEQPSALTTCSVDSGLRLRCAVGQCGGSPAHLNPGLRNSPRHPDNNSPDRPASALLSRAFACTSPTTACRAFCVPARREPGNIPMCCLSSAFIRNLEAA